jgi:Tfp pilus assembly protein PilF
LKKGDFGNAESILRRALAMDPNNYSGHHLLAQVLQQANRMAEAKKEFEIADSLRTAASK